MICVICVICGQPSDAAVVYKPIAGEKPLWDFPDGCLAHREVAAYLVSEVLGCGTSCRAPGCRTVPWVKAMVQLWQDIDPEQTAVEWPQMAVFEVVGNNYRKDTLSSSWAISTDNTTAAPQNTTALLTSPPKALNAGTSHKVTALGID